MVRSGGPRALGTAVALLTARVWVLCGGDGAVSTELGYYLLGLGLEEV